MYELSHIQDLQLLCSTDADVMFNLLARYLRADVTIFGFRSSATLTYHQYLLFPQRWQIIEGTLYIYQKVFFLVTCRWQLRNFS